MLWLTTAITMSYIVNKQDKWEHYQALYRYISYYTFPQVLILGQPQ